jgi:hypothetical protein
MTVEIHDKLIALLTEVDELKTKEAELKSEKQRQLEHIAQSETKSVAATMKSARFAGSSFDCDAKWKVCVTQLFAREEEEVIIVDDAHVVTDGENRETDSEAKRAWDARAKHLKQVR